MSDSTQDPLIQFYQLYPDAPIPQRADGSLSGSAPVRAARYCEPFTAASSFGWYVFPPVDFSLLWDGEIFYWKVDLQSKWNVLDHTVALPGFGEVFQKMAAGKTSTPGPPPFLGRSIESGLVQIWTGLCIRTRPGWSTLVRPLANYPRDTRYEVLDGLIETDWWFGPMVTPIRIRKTDEPIRFQARLPLYQIQPIPQDAYAAETLSSTEAHAGLSSLSSADWTALDEALTAHEKANDPRPGIYKREVQKRRKNR